MLLTGQKPPKKPNKRPKNVLENVIIFSLFTFILIQFVQLVLILFIHVIDINIDDDEFMKMMMLKLFWSMLYLFIYLCLYWSNLETAKCSALQSLKLGSSCFISNRSGFHADLLRCICMK